MIGDIGGSPDTGRTRQVSVTMAVRDRERFRGEAKAGGAVGVPDAEALDDDGCEDQADCPSTR